jgi:phosphatidate cytidylyltransferase
MTATPPAPTTPTIPPHPGSLVQRAIVGGIVTGGFAALAWADATAFLDAPPGWWLAIISVAIAAGGASEVVRMAAARGVFLRPLVVPAATVVVALEPLVARSLAPMTTDTIDLLAISLACVLGVMFIVEIGLYRRVNGALSRLAVGFTTTAAIGLPLACMMRLRLLADASGQSTLLPLASMLAVVKGGDIAAYLVGSMVGRYRLAPSLSPGKTWEGATASLLASLAIAWLLLNGSVWDVGRQPFGGWPLYGLAVGISGMLGDLSESLVKRELDSKDSGNTLGAMGGFLDLADATLFAAPLAWGLWVLGGLAF